MFWPFLIVSAIGAVFVRFGAMSVRAAMLSSALNAALFAIAILIALLLWQRHKAN